MRYRVRVGTRYVQLVDGELVLGRSPYCSLVLEHHSISRIHAALRVVGKRIDLVDMGSTFGTFLNGRRIVEPAAVRPGDPIRLGEVELALEASEDGEASRMVTGAWSAHDVDLVRAVGAPEAGGA